MTPATTPSIPHAYDATSQGPSALPLGPMIARPLYHALAALVVIDLLWLAISPLRLSTDSFVQLAQLLPLAIAAGWASLQFRRWHRFSLLCEGAAFMLLAWPALRLFNHLSMTTAFPLADASLAWGDQLIGFDWLAYLLWFDRYPLLLKAMELFYVSLSTYSAAFFLVILAVSRDPRARCGEFITLFFATAVISCLAGQFFPALSAAVHHAPSSDLFAFIDPIVGAYHLDHLNGLRENPSHALSLANLPGLVTFPSFHTAMGVVAIYCCRGVPALLAVSLTVNILMIASTPIYGAHYLVDVIAGAGVALAIILLYRRHLKTQPSPSVGALPA